MGGGVSEEGVLCAPQSRPRPSRQLANPGTPSTPALQNDNKASPKEMPLVEAEKNVLSEPWTWHTSDHLRHKKEQLTGRPDDRAGGALAHVSRLAGTGMWGG